MAIPVLRILFAEDDPDSRELICLVLNNKGLEVVCPESAREVLRIAKEQEFDAYLLDNWMSEFSGFDLCQQIREFDSHTPLIFYAAAAFPAERERALATGAQAYVTRPSNIDDLVDEIRSAVKASQAASDSRPNPIH
jgi:CheY-like chemotaxis protein